MSDTRHQVDCLQRRWPGFRWEAIGGRVIRCDDPETGRRLFGVVGPGHRGVLSQWHVKVERREDTSIFLLGPGAPSAVKAVEDWAWGHPAIKLLGIDGEPRRVAELEAEVARLRAQLGHSDPSHWNSMPPDERG